MNTDSKIVTLQKEVALLKSKLATMEKQIASFTAKQGKATEKPKACIFKSKSKKA